MVHLISIEDSLSPPLLSKCGQFPGKSSFLILKIFKYNRSTTAILVRIKGLAMQII